MPIADPTHESTRADSPTVKNAQRSKKSSALSVNQQVHETTALSVKKSSDAGAQLAIKEATAFATGYAKTSQQVTATLEAEIEKIRQNRQAAIASVPVEVEGDENFLMAFESDLQSALASIN